MRQESPVLFFMVAVEGGLAILAIVLGWWPGIDPFASFTPDGRAAVVGLLAAAPMMAAFILLDRLPFSPFQRIQAFYTETLLPFLRDVTVFELAVISAAAGLGEEALFRGLLQAWLVESWGLLGGVAAASALFGLLHMVTPTYAAVAALAGAYLGFVWIASENLLAPMLCHSAYDFGALLYLLRRHPPGENDAIGSAGEGM